MNRGTGTPPQSAPAYDSARAPVVHDEALPRLAPKSGALTHLPSTPQRNLHALFWNVLQTIHITLQDLRHWRTAICSTTRSSRATRSTSSSKAVAATSQPSTGWSRPHLRLRCYFLRRVPKEAATSSKVGTSKPTPTRGGCPSTKRRTWLSRQRWDDHWLKPGHEWPRLEPKWLRSVVVVVAAAAALLVVLLVVLFGKVLTKMSVCVHNYTTECTSH